MATMSSLAESEREEVKKKLCFVQYSGEHQIGDMMRLIEKDLSEPYSIYTYRHFLNNWPQLSYLVRTITCTRMYAAADIATCACRLWWTTKSWAPWCANWTFMARTRRLHTAATLPCWLLILTTASWALVRAVRARALPPYCVHELQAANLS